MLTDGLTPGDARGKLRWRRAGKPPSPLLASEFVLFMALHGLSTASAYTVLLSTAEKLLRINKSWPMLDIVGLPGLGLAGSRDLGFGFREILFEQKPAPFVPIELL